jgi:hypothetical protein
LKPSVKLDGQAFYLPVLFVDTNTLAENQQKTRVREKWRLIKKSNKLILG